jgi:hypothetical protein
MTEHDPDIDIDEQMLPGYLNLLNNYFELLRKQELSPSKGLSFTHVLNEDWEEELVVNVIDGLHRNKAAYMILDFNDYIHDREEHQDDFNRFFSNIWELNDPGFEMDNQKYLARIERIMRRSPEADPERCNQLILRNLPPLSDMKLEELEKLKELLFRRMENSLPLFIFFHEDFSQLLRKASRLPDIIWALFECTYCAEHYLFHPYGLRYIALMNRRHFHPFY